LRFASSPEKILIVERYSVDLAEVGDKLNFIAVAIESLLKENQLRLIASSKCIS